MTRPPSKRDFRSKICKMILKKTGMTMRILNMITFCVTVIQSAIHTTKTTYTIHSTPKKGPRGVRGWRGGGGWKWKKEPQRRTPCHYYNRVVYPWVIFFTATALGIKWTFAPQTNHQPASEAPHEFFWDCVIARGLHTHIWTFKLIVQLVHAGQSRSSSGDM